MSGLRRTRALAAAAPLAAALAAAGCAPVSGGRTTTTPTEVQIRAEGSYGHTLLLTREARSYLFELPASPAAAWAALPGIYRELGVPLSFLDEERRALGNDGWSVPRRLAGEPPSHWIDCGRGITATANADVYDVIMTIRSGVQGTGSGSVVETALTGSASPRDVSGGVVTCSSRGTLEKRIGELLLARVAIRGSQG